MCAHSHKCPVTGLDSSGVARCAVSSGDSCGGRRQVGTASHVHRGRSFVWLHASVCVVRDSAWMPASECAQSIKRTRSFAAIPGSYGLEPVYDRSGELLDRYAAERSGAPAVPRALPHARPHTRRTIARAFSSHSGHGRDSLRPHSTRTAGGPATGSGGRRGGGGRLGEKDEVALSAPPADLTLHS